MMGNINTDYFVSRAAELGEMLFDSINSAKEIQIIFGWVDSVDEDNETMDVATDADNILVGVSLNIVSGANSSVLNIPIVGSQVIIGLIEGLNERPVCLRFSEISKQIIRYSFGDSETENEITILDTEITLKRGNTDIIVDENSVTLNTDTVNIKGNEVNIDGSQINIDADSTLFNGGNKDGIPLSANVALELRKIQQNLNMIFQSLSLFAPQFDGPSWAGVISALSSFLPITGSNMTSVSDIENTSIKQ